ncbi:Enoyl-[acyl-carrier-protein] reductase [NADPH] FabL [bacterium HR23]|nr:Enoyl-[acyl-carrier-protein] reductase [NADPH] FabL [bacterium HR23]
MPTGFLQGKVALVTGGSGGIGRAIALALGGQGAQVAFTYFRGHEEARQTEALLTEKGVPCLRMRAHLGDLRQVKGLVQAVRERFGRLDILVNNAATGVNRPAMELEEKHWEWTLGVNARAPWLLVKEALPLMPPGACVVNITSLGSQRVLPHYFSVGVSKAALEALTRYLAVELAPRGIRVNAVAGGYVETDALQHFPNRDEMRRWAVERTPAGRLLTPEDMAGVVLFLCSPWAEMVRGQVIVVDGGYSLLG